MVRNVCIIASTLLFCVALQGCKSDADKCLGTGWTSTDVVACEAACNDKSLPSHQQYESCYFLGKIYERGTQVKNDRAKARAAYAKACKMGGTSGCRALKDLAKSKR